MLLFFHRLAFSPNKYTGTLGTHTDMDGVPFVLNSALARNPAADIDVSNLSTIVLLLSFRQALKF